MTITAITAIDESGKCFAKCFIGSVTADVFFAFMFDLIESKSGADGTGRCVFF